MTTAPWHAQLDAPFPVTAEHRAFFRKNGYIKLKQVLSPQLIEHYRQEISRQVIALNTNTAPMEKRNLYQNAFLQVMNLWTKSDFVREFVFSKRLAQIAADLMECRGVRLYHDQALYKEPGGGITPWHADQFYWPLDTDKTVTVWIPLQATPLELGPLAYSAGSHNFNSVGRDIEISAESEQKLSKALLESGLPLDETPFDIGEVGYHLGWTFHRAAANVSDRPREVMTIIYHDMDAKVLTPKYKAHESDLRAWLPGCEPGELAASPLNPVLWQR